MSAHDLILPEWHLAFLPGRRWFWQRLVGGRFGHVFAFGFDARLNVWLIYDTAAEATLLRALPRSHVDSLVVGVFAMGGEILRCRVRPQARFRPRVFATCVTAVGHLLGLRRCAVRPDGLYRMVLADGATPSFQEVRRGADFGRGPPAAG